MIATSPSWGSTTSGMPASSRRRWPTGVPDDIIAFLRKRLLANSPTACGTWPSRCRHADRTDELRQVEVPTLVLYGEHDDGWSAETQSEMAGHLDAECVVVPGAAHSPAVEAPETTAAALIRFWNTAESHFTDIRPTPL